MASQSQSQSKSKSKCNVKEQQHRCKFVFSNGFYERRDLEQYFWSESTVLRLMEALHPRSWDFEGHVCCLGAPSLAHAFYTLEQRQEVLLDIDTRFQYLPGFRFFDLRFPTICHQEDHKILVFDPPFFYIPLSVLFDAVQMLVKGDFKTKLLLGFLKREESSLLQVFAPFNLKRTKFELQYAHVKPNKWRNYALYSNVDLPGIKRLA